MRHTHFWKNCKEVLERKPYQSNLKEDKGNKLETYLFERQDGWFLKVSHEVECNEHKKTSVSIYKALVFKF